jgi:starch synthase (maltosyl-transferring)
MSLPLMSPQPGSQTVHHVGDRVRFLLQHGACGQVGWRALLRTNLTRGTRAREETVALAGLLGSEAGTFAGASWRDLPLQATPEGWVLDLPLTEVGHFRAKAYALDPEGRQHWPEGSDAGLSVLPDHLRTRNTLYCAFPRLFGPSRSTPEGRLPALEAQLRDLDRQGYTVIPPSGTLRDLTACVPHILETLGCRILHLLPLGPTPTTYARMGRYGSPYAQLDMAAIDPSLVAFDRRTTAEDQFRELATAVHLRGGLVFLDIVINHTGWGSRLMDRNPGWFHRDPDGSFHSPGAWGTTWADLVELDQRQARLWEAVAGDLLSWCRRGMDGFRCDAGYMVPVAAWQYLQARVRQEFPDTTFFLEGLGGAWETTEALLTEGGMQWAYSELFQNVEPVQVSTYLDHVQRQAGRMGPLVHYSETHDNDRLARRGRAWSLMRNRLSALSSHSGAYGFTAGVEWLAAEKIDVHECRGLSWDAPDNLVGELGRLNRLLQDHPCFFDGAAVRRLSPIDSPVLALSRVSRDGEDRCLVLVNLDPEAGRSLDLDAGTWADLGAPSLDLLGQAAPEATIHAGGVTLRLGPLDSYCLSNTSEPLGLRGDAYRAARAQAAWAYRHLAQLLDPGRTGPAEWRDLARLAAVDPGAFLAALPRLDADAAALDLTGALREALARPGYPPLVPWSLADLGRTTLVPPDHWLLLQDEAPFAVTLRREGHRDLHLRSVPWDGGHFAAIFPAHLDPGPEGSADAELLLERFAATGHQAQAPLRLAPRAPAPVTGNVQGLVLLTNGRGTMARLQADLGTVASKYDCLLGANLHPDSPSDRHILAKRVRVWAIAEGFLTALDGANLRAVEPGPPARWTFRANAGDGRSVDISLEVALLPNLNALRLAFRRGEPGPEEVRLTVRLDLEDRSYHGETRADAGLDRHFQASTLGSDRGFRFQPAPDRGLEAWASAGVYHPQPEWSRDLGHPVEAERGLADRGDAWSPGWFDLPLGEAPELWVSAEPAGTDLAMPPAAIPGETAFEATLTRASRAFLARRGQGTTVIAGYPWFLDWGRDTLIACRGLLAAGAGAEVADILRTFARFLDRGTLPNMLGTDSLANRETSDAPLWFALACEEACTALGPDFFGPDETLLDLLESLASHHVRGTPVGVRVDPDSGLVWSPSHFTWMDTNHPAGTPREGYPIELQALWIRLTRFLAARGRTDWQVWAARAEASLERYWHEERGWFSDCLVAPRDLPAAQATPDGHLRPNALFPIALCLVTGPRARRAVGAAGRHLLVPGGLRSLAPLPVDLPLPLLGGDGQPLNDPWRPYQGRYAGDEDTRRKPAYHNGTAWVWLLPTYCEALARAWDFEPAALAAARSILGSLDRLLGTGCLGHLPELLDGDTPHAPKGCDAQAWSATEALRVWKLLRQ